MENCKHKHIEIKEGRQLEVLIATLEVCLDCGETRIIQEAPRYKELFSGN